MSSRMGVSSRRGATIHRLRACDFASEHSEIEGLVKPGFGHLWSRNTRWPGLARRQRSGADIELSRWQEGFSRACRQGPQSSLESFLWRGDCGIVEVPSFGIFGSEGQGNHYSGLSSRRQFVFGKIEPTTTKPELMICRLTLWSDSFTNDCIARNPPKSLCRN